jgi:hypothetical protein
VTSGRYGRTPDTCGGGRWLTADLEGLHGSRKRQSEGDRRPPTLGSKLIGECDESFAAHLLGPSLCRGRGRHEAGMEALGGCMGWLTGIIEATHIEQRLHLRSVSTVSRMARPGASQSGRW